MKDLRYLNRGIYAAILAVVMAVVTMGCSGGAARQNIPETVQTDQSSPMKVHFIDVGQGDAALIEAQGHYMLIDAGENDKGSLVRDYLKQHNVKELDYVIGTHPHSDHIGGLDTVMNAFPVKNILLPEKGHTTKTFEDVLTAIEKQKLQITRPVVGTVYELGDARFTIIAPNDDYEDSINDWSVGIKLTYGNRSFVFTGDAEKKAEQDISSSGIDITADVLKVGHHASSTSSSEALIKAVNPEYAVIMCGQDNSYGFPHIETIDMLNQYQVQILRTDLQGTITAICDGDNITWESSGSGLEEREVIPDVMEQTVVSAEKENYILNTNSMKFHNTDCSGTKSMKEENRKSYSGTREELIRQGYSPCGTCKP